MQLRSLQYSEGVGTSEEWVLDGLLLGSKTLLVGRNSSGKSRTLSVIASLARHLTGQRPPSKLGEYACVFQRYGVEYKYDLHFKDRRVVFERLLVDGVEVLHRTSEGMGNIKFESLPAAIGLIQFQAPDDTIAAVVRRDSVQHSFLEPLHEWASAVRYYQFGTHFGKEAYAVFGPNFTGAVDDQDQNAVVAIFHEGLKKFGEKFEHAIIADMGVVGYPISKVGIAPPVSFEFTGVPGEVSGIYVKEIDLPGRTEQPSMSQGMFRVLSLIVHVNFAQLKNSAACIIVDDIGEGLDFNRSCRTINLLRKKAESSSIQIILSTNDKFIMNEVPLAEWAIVQRKSNHVAIRNYENSTEIFDDFRFTGLSNFSFFEMDVINSHEPTNH